MILEKLVAMTIYCSSVLLLCPKIGESTALSKI